MASYMMFYHKIFYPPPIILPRNVANYLYLAQYQGWIHYGAFEANVTPLPISPNPFSWSNDVLDGYIEKVTTILKVASK